jgi:hypothetical protein
MTDCIFLKYEWGTKWAGQDAHLKAGKYGRKYSKSSPKWVCEKYASKCGKY